MIDKAPVLEPAARAYLDDVRGLSESYDEKAALIWGRFESVERECAERMERAKREKLEAARALNAEYRQKAAAAASRRAEQAEHPADILAGMRMLDATMGGPCRDALSMGHDSARAAVLSEIERREEREAAERENARGRHVG